ncbi:MAG: DNA polymerase III subunit gamma/tau [Ardenticatenaceae bacterium]
MSQQALYRKWRSGSFDELVGQHHVVQTLQNALHSDRVAHAYIFSGPRGTGKTTSARILAKAVNCIAIKEARPCNECHICTSITNGSALDLIEIDAASNTQVDKVRDVIVEKVHFTPTQFTKKVYIIDEVHMLSNSAFNALLKTIEEPPPHAMFVLATTEIHKIPATILSRCQRLDFRRISLPEIVNHLALVLHHEGITAEQKVLELVARQATGSMRDALSLLDQLLAYGGTHLTLAQARAALGLASTEAVQGLIDYILAQDTGTALQLVNQLLDQGTDPRQFLVDLLEHLRALLLVLAGSGPQLLNLPETTMAHLRTQKNYIKAGPLIRIIRLFNQAGADLKVGLQPQLPLELAIVEAILALQERGVSPAPAPQLKLADLAPPPAPRPAQPISHTIASPPLDPSTGSGQRLRQRPPTTVRQAQGTAKKAQPAVKSKKRTSKQPPATGKVAQQKAAQSKPKEKKPSPQSPSVQPSRSVSDKVPTPVQRNRKKASKPGATPELISPRLWDLEQFKEAAASDSKAPPAMIPPKPSRQPELSPAPEPSPAPAPSPKVEARPVQWWLDHWEEFLTFLAKRGKVGHQAARRLSLRLCKPYTCNDNELIIVFNFHQALDQFKKSQGVVAQALSDFSQTPMKIGGVLRKNTAPPKPAKTKFQKAADDPVISEAINFGGQIIDVVSPTDHNRKIERKR